MYDKWRISFIDTDHIILNNSNEIPQITNNFTERIYRTIKAVYSGK